MKSDQMLALYKTAASGMTKKALDFDSLKSGFQSLNPGAQAAILGGLGGAGLGIASHMLTPKDEDEDTTGRLLRNILTGAALGSIASYGGKTLYNAMKNNGFGGGEGPEPGWYQRNVPELSYSRAATAGGLGLGAYTGIKGLDALRGGIGLNRLHEVSPSAARAIKLFRSASPSTLAKSPELRAIDNALGAANISLGDRLLSKLPGKLPDWMGGVEIPAWLGGDAIRAASGRQAGRDAMLLAALRRAGHATPAGGRLSVNPNEARILASRFYNPRKVMNSLRRGKGKHKILMALAAMGLLGTGFALRNNDR